MKRSWNKGSFERPEERTLSTYDFGAPSSVRNFAQKVEEIANRIWSAADMLQEAIWPAEDPWQHRLLFQV
jgi:hypothetical protein